MSLRYALLGLLAREPASGYELARRFRGGVGRYAWHAQQSQVYPELNHLAADSLVEVVDEGPRGRRTYAITSAGRDDLHGWLTAADDRPIVRNEQVLRLFLLPCLGREDARVLLQRQAESSLRDLEALRATVGEEKVKLGGGPLPMELYVAELGLRYFQHLRDFSIWALEELAR